MKTSGRKTTWAVRFILLLISLLLSALALQPQPAQAFHVPFAVGDVFAGLGYGWIGHYNPSGTLLEVLDTTSNSLDQAGMCFDAASNMYSANFEAGTMSKFNNMGGLLVPSWGGPFSNNPESCVVDAVGNIYVGEVDLFPTPFAVPSYLRKFDANGTLLAQLSPAREDVGIDWIDLAADQCTLFYTSEGLHVKRFDVCTNTQLPDFAAIPNPNDDPNISLYALRIRPNGEVLVAGGVNIYHFSANGTLIRIHTLAELDPTLIPDDSAIFALALDPDGTSFWTGEYVTGRIYRIDCATGTVLKKFTAALHCIPDPQGSSNQLCPFGMAGLTVYGEPSVAKHLDPPGSSCGRMTGGGSVFTADGTRVTHGFELHCSTSPNDCSGKSKSDNLEINWGNANNFHLTNLTSALCTNDPTITPNPPATGFNTYLGVGTGRYNGVPGYTASWTFTDAGEPGTKDLVKIDILDPQSQIIFSVSGNLSKGNQQAHGD